jgi:5-methylcytosine-specific restriction endonuclease McrA
VALPIKKRVRIFMRDAYTCRYCGYDMTLHFAYPHLRVLTLDHVVPRDAGGNNDEQNLVTCCASCNSRKGNLSIEAFLRDLHTTVWPVAPALRDAEQRDGRA